MADLGNRLKVHLPNRIQPSPNLRAWATVDLSAIEANVSRLAEAAPIPGC